MNMQMKIMLLIISIILIKISNCEDPLKKRYPESSVTMASTFGCDSKKKIEIKDMINKCECSDGSECIWTTDRRPVYGNIPF